MRVYGRLRACVFFLFLFVFVCFFFVNMCMVKFVYMCACARFFFLLNPHHRQILDLYGNIDVTEMAGLLVCVKSVSSELHPLFLTGLQWNLVSINNCEYYRHTFHEARCTDRLAGWG